MIIEFNKGKNNLIRPKMSITPFLRIKGLYDKCFIHYYSYDRYYHSIIKIYYIESFIRNLLERYLRNDNNI